MGLFEQSKSGRLIVSCIYNDLEMMETAAALLEKQFGRIDAESDEIVFLHASAYVEELGDNLKRKLFAFIKSADPTKPAEHKAKTKKIEEKLSEKVGDLTFRRVNLDPLILTCTGLTLLSSKDATHRVCVGEDTFAEKTLALVGSKFSAFEWTAPDYCEPEVLRFLRDRLSEIPTMPEELAPHRATLRLW